jgi:small conductance mechanosensitive channel
VALSQLGIQLGPVLAGLGIAGFIVGFALQDTLSNFAAGLMILIYRPYDVGDAVEAGGVMGTVKAMNLVSTTIATWDNQKLVVPNGKIWGDVTTCRWCFSGHRFFSIWPVRSSLIRRKLI